MIKQAALIALSLAVTAGVALNPLAAQDQVGVDNRALIGEPAGAPLSGEELTMRTEELTGIMRCPVCQGLSIADSPTMIAQAMKEEVRQFLADGYTEDQILRYFEMSYGEFIRLEPKAKGFNLLVWIAPLAALILGLILVVSRLRKPPARATEELSAEADDLAAYREQVRKELAS